MEMILLWLVPKNLLSYIVGLLVHLPLPAPLSTWSMTLFVNHYNINMEEAEYPIKHYKSIGDLFIRRLKPGVRPISNEKLVHPADAELTSRGKVNDNTLIQAKGRAYTLDKFLQTSGTKGEQFKGDLQDGSYLTYYLCPTDYHRVHSPVDGEIVSAVHVPGYLWPVNDWSVTNIDELFAINERVIVWIKTEWGPVAVVFVGATNVGKMTMSFDEELVTNQYFKGQKLKEKVYDTPIPVKRGDELGIFNMGSTVIMVYPNAALSEIPEKQNWKTRMGEGLLETSQ